ncbi:glucosaminidase domain-containing protein [Paraburkholderia sp. SARCC-3016]|uniref:glycoside hydrolase family 73 protein n=1 Tax=Paraburkholderia sp. SARCC-3016 TaxID=3058611 RepID=UPI002806E6AB|nr:glucosaminidase domain-containing protein [Paraburkholderia sp. SARCC-3016]MDQ7981341.1 glucosaminidase domain-containing protein [Paraburkholderia sp. SARCC-3016]
MKPEEFIAAIAPAAQDLAARTKIPASFTVAQAALESSWGASKLAQLGFNLFGVKADRSWTGPTLSLPTTEYLGGKPTTVQALWRKYDSWLASLEDRARFLLDNPRYRAAFLCTDGESFAAAVQAAGYATDPQYAMKILAIMRGRNLHSLDGPVALS